MTFGEALEAAKGMKDGVIGALPKKRITRRGWNGKGMWVRYIDLYYDREFELTELPGSQGTWMPFLVMKTVDNLLVPWLASQTDVLADDWEVLP